MFNVDALAGRWCWLYNSIYCAQCIAEAGAIALKERFAATHTHIFDIRRLGVQFTKQLHRIESTINLTELAPFISAMMMMTISSWTWLMFNLQYEQTNEQVLNNLPMKIYHIFRSVASVESRSLLAGLWRAVSTAKPTHVTPISHFTQHYNTI